MATRAANAYIAPIKFTKGVGMAKIKLPEAAKEYFSKIGRKGGKKSKRKLSKKDAAAMGKKGGAKSRRTLTRAQALAMIKAREEKKKQGS